MLFQTIQGETIEITTNSSEDEEEEVGAEAASMTKDLQERKKSFNIIPILITESSM